MRTSSTCQSRFWCKFSGPFLNLAWKLEPVGQIASFVTRDDPPLTQMVDLASLTFEVFKNIGRWSFADTDNRLSVVLVPGCDTHCSNATIGGQGTWLLWLLYFTIYYPN
jgi:hypothetical protein